MLDRDRLAERLAGTGGVVAVAPGGSRARGQAHASSDWDFGLYYRRTIDVAAIRRLGYRGHVVAPAAWGRLMNGGAWLLVDGERVDLLYRNLDVVERWTREAEAGRFEVDDVAGHSVGLPMRLDRPPGLQLDAVVRARA
jgi:predicted nucleotidyltransferase